MRVIVDGSDAIDLRGQIRIGCRLRPVARAQDEQSGCRDSAKPPSQ
jgi:hypothetical protein